MSVQKVTLLSPSNSNEKDTSYLVENTTAAEFVAVLPTQVTVPSKKWQVNIDSIGFRAVFSNIKHLEEYGPHVIAWNCNNFTQLDLCQDFDNTKPETFPSYSDICNKYFVIEGRIDESKRYGDMKMFAAMMNDMLNWDEFLDGEKRLVYSAGTRGLTIEGDGNVVLLLSSVLADWLGLSEIGIRVKFGTHRNSYYNFLDFSGGVPYAVEGNVKNVLTSHNVEPSLISIMASFNYGGWKEKCLAIIPYDKGSLSSARLRSSSTNCHSNQMSEQYFHKVISSKEPVYIDVGEDVRQVKIQLRDQHERTLRLIGNKYLPTIVSLTFKELASTMPKKFMRRVRGYDSKLTTYLDPPLQNTQGKWQVALHSAFIPTNIDWVGDKDKHTEIKFIIDVGEGKKRPFVVGPLPSSVFRSPQSLIEYLKVLIQRESSGKALLTEVDTPSARIRIVLQDGIEIHMYRKLAAVLGLDNIIASDGKVYITESVTATTIVDVTRIFPACIAIHCSLVKPSVLGNSVSHLLDIIPTNKRSGSEGELIVYVARKPMYYDIRSDHIANFEILLKDVPSVRLIKFYDVKGAEREIVLINLMFRERKN